MQTSDRKQSLPARNLHRNETTKVTVKEEKEKEKEKSIHP
jgi:hypothetical protein